MPGPRRSSPADRRRARAARALGLSLAEYDELEHFSEWGDVPEELRRWRRDVRELRHLLRLGSEAQDLEEAAAQLRSHLAGGPRPLDPTLALTVPSTSARRLLGVAIFLVLVVPTKGLFESAATWMLWSLASMGLALGLRRLVWSIGGERLRAALRLGVRCWYLVLPAAVALGAWGFGLLDGTIEAALAAGAVLANGLLLREGMRWDQRRRRRQVAGELRRLSRIRRDRLERVEKFSELLGALRERDPEFDECAFQERVCRIFTAVHEASSREELDPIRPFVSDAVFERLELEVEERRAIGVREELRRLFVQRVAVAHMETRDHFDALTVGIRAQGDLVRRARNARGAAAPQSLTSVGAFWTFVRRSNAVTRDSGGLLEGRCPSCGAPAALNQSVRCESCQTLLRSAEHDWILTEVTQGEAWMPRAPSRVPGIEALRQDDPAFGVQALEDRASVIFCRLLASQRSGGTGPLECMASAELCAETRRAPDSPLRHGHSVEISAVETRSIAEKGDGFEAVVSVKWRGQPASGAGAEEADGSAAPVRGTAKLVLGRQRGLRSDPERCISSAHCAACGAPDTGRGGGNCAFCGVCLNDGSRDWILVGFDEHP